VHVDDAHSRTSSAPSVASADGDALHAGRTVSGPQGRGSTSSAAARVASSTRSPAPAKPPREIASTMSLAHASRNAGIALGSSKWSTLPTDWPTHFRGVLAAPFARSVVDFGAPVVRSAPSGKEEGRVPSVSRVESRPIHCQNQSAINRDNVQYFAIRKNTALKALDDLMHPTWESNSLRCRIQ